MDRPPHSNQEPTLLLPGRAHHVFVGRKREMSVLRAALSSASSGQPQIVMLAGEPGIGKTSTAREFTEYSISHGAEVIWGRCYESIGMPPY